jgi:hypothetical protein
MHDSLEESLEYGQRFQDPAAYIDNFMRHLKGRIRFSAVPKFDAFLVAMGSAVIAINQEAIKIGGNALIRDSELFKTILHEEMHLRLFRKARKGNERALEMVTDPDTFSEEDYAERVALRYWRMYERTFGKFRH